MSSRTGDGLNSSNSIFDDATALEGGGVGAGEATAAAAFANGPGGFGSAAADCAAATSIESCAAANFPFLAAFEEFVPMVFEIAPPSKKTLGQIERNRDHVLGALGLDSVAQQTKIYRGRRFRAAAESAAAAFRNAFCCDFLLIFFPIKN